MREQRPDKLRELVDAFDEAAWANLVYPLDNRDRFQKFADVSPVARERADAPRTFYPGAQTTHRDDILPMIDDRSFRIETRFDHAAGDEGVLWAVGDPIGGIVMYVENGALNLHYNGFGDTVSLPPMPLRAGARTVTFDYEALGGRQGRGRVLSDGAVLCGWTALSPTLSFGVFEGLDIGIARRGPVLWTLYEEHGAFRFTGAIEHVRVTPGARADAAGA